MAKSSKTKKSKAAYSTKDNEDILPAKDNSSKYQSTKDAVMDIQMLDPQDGLRKLFYDSLKDIYWAENQLIKALPKMAKSSSLQALQDAITNHLEQTKTHAERLEQAFEMLGKKAQAKKCDAMEGITKEGEGGIESTDSGTPARNLGIIMASQKAEHYEIAAYTGIIKLAGKLNLADIADLLSQTLEEEKQAYEILAGIADNDIFVKEEEA